MVKENQGQELWAKVWQGRKNERIEGKGISEARVISALEKG